MDKAIKGLVDGKEKPKNFHKHQLKIGASVAKEIMKERPREGTPWHMNHKPYQNRGGKYEDKEDVL